MALFQRPDGSYIVGLHSEAERWSDYYFLDYRNGKLRNISKTIPQYSLENVYELPRRVKRSMFIGKSLIIRDDLWELIMA